MDYNKIGNYIQQKRKDVGLTQAELGDMLGVTSKAVSKWECGVALPDVVLFSDLSKILKIEISELLNGEDKKEVPVDRKKNIVIIFLSIFLILSLIVNLFLGLFFINNYDKVHVYDLVSENKDFTIRGKLISIEDKNYIAINNVFSIGNDKAISYAYSLEYGLIYKDRTIVKYGSNNNVDLESDHLFKLSELLNGISVITEIEDEIDINSFKNDFLVLYIEFLDENNTIQSNGIPISLKK